MSFWDKRYQRDGYLFGTEPAEFVREQAGGLAPGSRVLCLADGEGRNSVHLAGLGHDVTAFDASVVAQDKARALAADRGVSVAFHHARIEDWDWSQTYDAVVGVFIQFAPPDLRDRLFGWMAQAVVPGGRVMLHGYAPRQVGYGTGGPGVPENLYTEALLRQAFEGWEILRLADYDREIDEGPGHSGRSALVDLVARKPV
ncbi:SAM-dependent methyltransferase [Antarcticimicrobium sediminis]|uniref:Class I SAM-dependent methyltransferase n=1 Tax=Antarcticimicrobium sediminis TaxID=2546227 RepID=A0A4R5EKM1_9RHOB|nr:class I SAM-dependent methyltransferase [Antarcticimicrobium sediminis]TDE35225.1 class I SAM-dependent methyltransferase [Antarcticimicrobium sediminis]